MSSRREAAAAGRGRTSTHEAKRGREERKGVLRARRRGSGGVVPSVKVKMGVGSRR